MGGVGIATTLPPFDKLELGEDKLWVWVGGEEGTMGMQYTRIFISHGLTKV